MVSRRLWNWNREVITQPYAQRADPGCRERCLLVTWVHSPSLGEIFCDSPSNCITKVLPPSARAHNHLSFAGLHFGSPTGFFGVKCLDSERTCDTCDFNWEKLSVNYLCHCGDVFWMCIIHNLSITVPAALHVWVLLTL